MFAGGSDPGPVPEPPPARVTGATGIVGRRVPVATAAAERSSGMTMAVTATVIATATATIRPIRARPA
jgi:hypothetical protein